MDFNTFANSAIYANMQVAIKVSKNGEMKVQNRSEFLEEAWQAWQAAADKRAEDKLRRGPGRSGGYGRHFPGGKAAHGLQGPRYRVLSR